MKIEVQDTRGFNRITWKKMTFESSPPLSMFVSCIHEGLCDVVLFHIFIVHALLFIHVRQIWYIMISSENVSFCTGHAHEIFFSSLINFLYGLPDVAHVSHKMHENFYEPDYGFSYAFVFYCMTFMILIVLNERARNGDGFAIKIFSHETLWIWRWIWHHKA